MMQMLHLRVQKNLVLKDLMNKSGEEMKKNEIGEGFLIFLLSGFFIKESLKVHKGDWALSPALFPLIVASGGFLLALALIYQGFKKKQVQGEKDLGQKDNRKEIFFILALSLLYLMLLNYIGFLPVSIVYLGLFMVVLGERRWWVLASMSIISPLFIYYVFANLLDVFLP